MKKATLLLCTLLLILSLGCQSISPESIPQDLEPRNYFKKAQNAIVERSDYDTALVYYRTFIERYPNDTPGVAEATYEIAFIHYKKGELEKAEALFNEVLDFYNRDGSEKLPQWPEALSLIMISKIEAETVEESPETAEKPPDSTEEN